MTAEQAIELIQSQFGLTLTPTAPAMTLAVPTERWVEVARFARHDLGCAFFAFLTAIDWKENGLEVVVRVENLDDHFSLTLRTPLPPGTSTCPSLVELYRGANWMERECYDMFGIVFDGHPDLRRILLPDDWIGHPLLKSYDIDTPYPPYR